MELEKQVASLELSKELKDLGYPQKGLFSWKCYGFNVPDAEQELLYGDPMNYENKYTNPIVFVAPTVAELGEWLPIECRYGQALDLDWFVSFEGMESIILSSNEANSRAKMLIWLVENKLISF